MNFSDNVISYQPSVDTQRNQFREEHLQNRNKIILQICFISAFILLLLTSIITLIYIFTNKQQTKSLCILDFNSSTSTSTPITSTFQQLLTTTTTDKIDSNIFILNPCIQRHVEYKKWGMPIQNYSLYPIDASLIVLTAIISLNVSIYPSNIDCSWSLDIFPMDGRSIPLTGRPTNSVFGLYDQNQNLTVEESNISTLNYLSNGTGKFLIAITGAWYGYGDIGCQANGIINICFYNSFQI